MIAVLIVGLSGYLVYKIWILNISRPSSETSTPVKTETWVKDPNVFLSNTTSTCTLKLDDGTYRMYLLGGGGIVYMESSDGKSFGDKKPTGIAESSKNMMISNPAVLKIKEDDWIMIYELQPVQKQGQVEAQPSSKTQRNLYLGTSKDGKSFQDVGLVIDSAKEDNYFASVPELTLLPDGKIRMYYVSGGEAIGSAISSDSGRSWQREKGYRLEDLAVDPDILYENGKWIMYYSTLPKPQSGNRNAIYKATSNDGLTWQKVDKILEPETEMGFVVDPDVIKIGENYRMFFGQSTGDIGAPGAIGLYAADKK